MVVAVEYISKEESTDVAEGAASAQHGVTGILAVQGAFAEHAAMLDRLGAPWKLLRAAEDFDDSIDRVILPGGESTTQGQIAAFDRLVRSDRRAYRRWKAGIRHLRGHDFARSSSR